MIQNKGKVRSERVVKPGKKSQTRVYTIATCPICSSEFEALFDNVKRGITKSCGCYKTKNVNLVKTRTHKSWQGLKDRCSNSNLPCYQRYGARGITFDPRWEKFDLFLEDMGICPVGMSLDRIDNNGNYNKENCRWATIQQQCNNRRSNYYVEPGVTFADWCRINKLDYKSAWHFHKAVGLKLEEVKIKARVSLIN